MTEKNELYVKLGKLKGQGVCGDKIDNIVDILNIIPGDAELKEISGIKSFLREDNPSRLDDPERQLDNMLKDLREWVSKNVGSAEGYVMQTLNKRTRVILFGFLTAIIVLALAAIACTIAHTVLGEAFPAGDKIAEIIGTSDFVLGVIGFVVERFDDLGKREVRMEAEKVKEGASPDKLVKKCNEYRSINVNITMFNKDSHNTYNYYNRP